MARFERGKGPVVLCFSSGPAPSGAASKTTLEPLPIEAAHFAAGTGADRLDIAKAARAFADKPMPLGGSPLEPLVEYVRYNSRTVRDFITEKEKPQCRLHLFVDIVKDGASVEALLALLEVLLPYEIPLGLHAFLCGPEKTAYSSLNRISGWGRDKLPVLTTAGADYTLGPVTDWDKLIEAYRAIVMLFEGEAFENVNQALTENYSHQRDDVAHPPLRLGDFDGVTGDLGMEVSTGPDAPTDAPWKWHSDDLAMIVSSRGDHMERLLRILTRSHLPDDVAEMVTLRGRPVITFGSRSMLTLVPMLGASCPFLFDTRAERSLFEIASAAGKRCARVLDAAHSAVGTFSFDGDRAIESAVTVAQDAGSAVAAAVSALASTDLLFVSVADLDIEPLRAAVADRDGALLLVSGSELSLYADGLAPAASTGAYRDLFATVLALAAVDAPATSARSLVTP
jgi:hypothetical protein